MMTYAKYKQPKCLKCDKDKMYYCVNRKKTRKRTKLGTHIEGK